MPKYEVTIKQIEIYVFEEVEADSEDAALEKCYEIMDTDEKNKYHSDSDSDGSAYEL